MFNSRDYECLQARVPYVQVEASKARLETIEPFPNERRSIRHLISEFIGRRKRLVYGGVALNEHLKMAQAPPIYLEDEETDIEFYSFQAMQDVVDLCDMLDSLGFKNVEAKLAVHDDTYTIVVNYQKYCDVTYMPRNIFSAIPYSEINGTRYVHPHFAALDYMRVVCDPLTSFFRLDKDFPRLQLLCTHFPFPKPDDTWPRSPDHSARHPKIIQFLCDHASDTAAVGQIAYEAFCAYTGRTPLTPPDSQHIAPIEFYSGAFRDHVRTLIEDVLKDEAPEYTEHHRFSDFWGHKGVIRIAGRIAAIVYDTGHRGLPCLGASEATQGINITCHAVTLCHSMISKTWHDTMCARTEAAYAGCVACDLIDLRNNRPEPGLPLSGLLREFVMDQFVGRAMSPMHIKSQRIRARERRKRPVVLKYRPGQKNKDFIQNFSFDNTSGNPINNARDTIARLEQPCLGDVAVEKC